jgi:hypothetical protein
MTIDTATPSTVKREIEALLAEIQEKPASQDGKINTQSAPWC